MTLKSGRRITFRIATHDDRSIIETGFTQLSGHARYMRFLTARNHLSDAELDRLTQPRQDSDEVVFGAVTQGTERPVGLARFARLSAQASSAEFALTVVDEFQQQGVGTHMFIILAQVAQKCAITTLSALVHRRNHAMRRLLARFGASICSGNQAEIEVSVPVTHVLERFERGQSHRQQT